jgi:FAD/FMN-containing dehydrogenase
MDTVGSLRALIGEDGVIDAAEVATRAVGVGRAERMTAAALARPKTTEQVAAVLRWCNDNGVKVVAHGGMSGLVNGTLSGPNDVALSLERMRAIESIDADQRIAVVQAGVVLETLQNEVDAHGLQFPLDLGGRGSATIGGNASTNAGGNRVIRYGMMRDMVLGLEAVLADGTIVSSMNRLIKNNTGYDLKQLFVGGEGTLGVITRLVLRLREKPRSANVAFVATDRFEGMTAMLRHMDRTLGGTLSAFEVMWNSFYRLVTTPPSAGRPPLGQDYPYYMLIEALGGDQKADSLRFEAALETALADGLICDAVIAKSENECKALWALRDDVGQVRRDGSPIVFDVSLPTAEMEKYTKELAAALPGAIGGHTLWIFGHLGDGNLHVIVQVAPEKYPDAKPKVEALVYAPLKAIGGSVSAEHGIGLDKKPWLAMSRSEAEVAAMRAIKAALDPKGTLNPGKIF